MPEEAPVDRRKEKEREPPPAPASRGSAHRLTKLMPGGVEEAHPRSAAEVRKARAAQEHFEVAFTPTDLGVPVWTITSATSHVYRVAVPAFPDREGAQCSCPDFLSRGLGTCKHLEATLAQAAASPPPSAPSADRARAFAPGWAQIERSQESALRLLRGPVPPDPAVLAVALRRAGRLLISEA